MHIFHLLDGHTAETAVVTAHQLFEKLPARAIRHSVATLDGGIARRFATDGLKVQRFRRHAAWDFSWSARLRRAAGGVDLIHAWSLDTALFAAGAMRGQLPIVATVMAPPRGGRWTRWVQAVGGHSFAAHVCSAGVVERRLIEGGIDQSRCVVIRPGVDFHAIHEAKRAVPRQRMGRSADAKLLALLPPPSRTGGHFYATWAAAVLRQIDPAIQVLIPGVSREQRRLRRLVASVRMPELARFTESSQSFETLLAAADVVVAAAVDDIETTSLGWAMAAGVPIVASAVPSVTEFLADHHNALLCKPAEPITLAARIRIALDDAPLAAKLADTARGQAFEVFSIRRMVDQYRRLYENVVNHRPVQDGIVDAAMRA